MQKINKYKIGLAVIAVFTLGLGIFVAVQAGSAKQDNETFKKATKIADALNTYTLYKSAPTSLAAANIKDVPDTVSYTKISENEFKFCVTYQADSSGFDPSNVQADLMAAAYGGEKAYTDSSYNYTDSYLYVDPIHHKGENCQTINLSGTSDYYNYGNDGSTSNGNSSCKYTYSSDQATDDKNYQAYSDCLDKEANSTAGGTSTVTN